MRSDIITLGLGGQNHDFSAAVAINGEIVSAISEERISRLKHGVDIDRMRCDFTSTEDLLQQSGGWTEYLRSADRLGRSAQYVLEQAGVSPSRLDLVTYCCDRRVLPDAVRSAPLWRVNHHLAHGASSFLAAPFESAVVCVADGAGDRIQGTTQLESVTVFHGKDGQLERLWRANDLHSLGGLYEAATNLAGYQMLQEGKTMALASYGTDRFVPAVESLFTFHADGGYEIAAQAPPDDRIPARVSKVSLLREVCGLTGELTEDDRRDVARAVQVLLEKALTRLVLAALERTGEQNLCLAGGVALNGVANYKLSQLAEVGDIYIQPHAGDGGLAVGGALLATEQLAPGDVRKHPMRHAYLGRCYTRAEVDRDVAAAGDRITVEQPDDICERAARFIADGGILGWFQDGAEWGPRSLGNRSILADPRRPEVKQRLDTEVKFREPFRPYAPAVLGSEAGRFFELDRPSPYMLLVAPVRAEVRELIPAVVHVDGTARVQTVDARTNPKFARLLERFAVETGVPMLLNTSLNVNREPIVETPADALRLLLNSNIDAMVLADLLVTRRERNPVT